MKNLVLTVGGSCHPIITSIKENKPDKVYFICSDDTPTAKGSYVTVIGEGCVCGSDIDSPDEPNILTQVGYPKETSSLYEIEKVKNFDDINECYQVSIKLLAKIREKNPDAQIIADYTGGTKSMSCGLAAAAMDIGNVAIGLVKGERSNLVQVQNGTERVRLTYSNTRFVDNMFKTVKRFLEKFYFKSATELLENCCAMPGIPEETDREIGKYITLARAFDAWDSFDHKRTWQLLSGCRPFLQRKIMFLEAVIWSRARIDEDFSTNLLAQFSKSPKGHGYEIVEDLLLNAERRGTQGHFDDACARLYRTLELLVQARLRYEHSISTGDVDLSKLPSALQGKYENWKDSKGKVKLPLLQSYELLAEISPQDTLANVYQKYKDRLRDSLEFRNYSFAAHGFRTIGEGDFQNFHILCLEIINDFLAGSKKFVEREQLSLSPSERKMFLEDD
jgi:CRISPR-associated protein (TIGR02710 family)